MGTENHLFEPEFWPLALEMLPLSSPGAIRCLLALWVLNSISFCWKPMWLRLVDCLHQGHFALAASEAEKACFCLHGSPRSKSGRP